MKSATSWRLKHANQSQAAQPRCHQATKVKIKAHSSRVLDYSATMSQYERESQAKEAKLKAARKKRKEAENHLNKGLD